MKGADLPIPVAFGIFVERGKHDREDHLDVVCYEVAEVFIVPKVKGPLGNLTVSA